MSISDFRFRIAEWKAKTTVIEEMARNIGKSNCRPSGVTIEKGSVELWVLGFEF